MGGPLKSAFAVLVTAGLIAAGGTALGALISRGVSDKHGIWRIDLEGQLTGKFFAKVRFQQVGSFLCKGGRSTAVHVRP